VAFAGRTRAQTRSLEVTRPAARQVVAGTFEFAAVVNRSARIASVEFLIGSKRLGLTTSMPPQVLWNTGFASDGTYCLQVVARNAAGQEIASAQRSFIINNHGNMLAVVSPSLDRPLSGLVQLSLRGIDRQYYPAMWILNVDGKEAAVTWTDHTGQPDTRTRVRIDTTRYSNGPHELYIAMHSDFWQKGRPRQISWYNWRGGFSRVVTFHNQRSLVEIESNYLHVYLKPEQTASLTCRRLFTDGSSEPCASPRFASNAPEAVSVSPRGIIRAEAREGFSTIIISDSGKSTEAYVWVRKNPGIPHFSGDGHILQSYAPGKSLFLIAPFALQANFLEKNPGLLADVRGAGINTLSQGFYSNPRNLTASFDNWRRTYDASFGRDWLFARQHAFHILATGDEVCRNIGSEAWWTLNWPFGRTAVQYAVQSLAASGAVIGIDMVDEASMMWGVTPTPPGRVGGRGSFTSISCARGQCHVSWPDNPVNEHRFPSGTRFALRGSRISGLNTPRGRMFTATHITWDSFEFQAAAPVNGNFDRQNDPNLGFLWWAGNIGGCPAQPCNPPVSNDALTRITDWIHEVRPHLPISWPALGLSPPSVQGNWMGKGSISDYASHYWISFSLRHTYTWAQGIQELGYWMSQSFYKLQSMMMLERPQLMLISVAGPDYVKETGGAGHYSPPRDLLNQPAMSPAGIISTMMTGAALGCAGERLYYFENPDDTRSRSAGGVGSEFQTGVLPAARDPIVQENWRALSNASRLITRLTPYLFGVALNSPAYGQGIVTAARRGSDGTMLMVINDNDWPRTIGLDFGSYTSTGQLTRYLINADSVSRSSYRRMHESATLRAGEAAVYVFPSHNEKTSSNAQADNVTENEP
jgi:hypothetical protein